MSRQSVLLLPALGAILLLALAAPALAYSADAAAWYTQGNALVAADNLTGAIDAYDHATALEPAYYEAYDAKADALNRDGQFSAALAASDAALAINGSYVQGWINRGQILYNIGYVYEDQKKDATTANEYYTQQLLAFDKAIALEPGNADAWFNKAYALAGMQRYDEAIAAFDKVKELNPDYPKIDKNREIAVQLRDRQTPPYMKYVPVAIGIAVVAIGVGVWHFFLREKKGE